MVSRLHEGCACSAVQHLTVLCIQMLHWQHGSSISSRSQTENARLSESQVQLAEKYAALADAWAAAKAAVASVANDSKHKQQKQQQRH